MPALAVDSKWEGAMSKKLDAAIDALVDALAELPEHELEGWQRGNRLGIAGSRVASEIGNWTLGRFANPPCTSRTRRSCDCFLQDHSTP